MTYQEYKDELACLKHIARDLKLARLAMWDTLTKEQQDGFWFFDNYSVLGESDRRVVDKYMRRNDDIRKDESSLRRYRSALAYWFWSSRLGNPPVLH